MIDLVQGDLRLEVNPALGGSITRLTWRGRDVLRPTAQGADHPLQTASFPLVPYANRIANGVFSFAGRDVRLKRNLAGDAHPLHGQGWLAPWTVAETSHDRIALRFEHEPGEWPWAYTAEHGITLSGRRIRMDVTVRNRDSRAMPVGLGFHPAFPAPPGTRLYADVDGVWLADETILPTELVPVSRMTDWRREPEVAVAEGMDHCHTGWKGAARIALPSADMRLTITASEGMRWLHLYVPPGRGYFCLEPVSQMPDPFRQPRLEDTGIVSLEPGAAQSGWMEIEVGTLSGSEQ